MVPWSRAILPLMHITIGALSNVPTMAKSSPLHHLQIFPSPGKTEVMRPPSFLVGRLHRLFGPVPFMSPPVVVKRLALRVCIRKWTATLWIGIFGNHALINLVSSPGPPFRFNYLSTLPCMSMICATSVPVMMLSSGSKPPDNPTFVWNSWVLWNGFSVPTMNGMLTQLPEMCPAKCPSLLPLMPSWIQTRQLVVIGLLLHITQVHGSILWPLQ
jgi:hypothetical protein